VQSILKSGLTSHLFSFAEVCVCQISPTIRIFPHNGVRKGFLTSYSKFQMAAATMLDSGNQALFDTLDEFLFKVATFLPNLMNFGRKMMEQHQFF